MPQQRPQTGFYLLLSLLALLAAGKVILADTMDPDAFWHMRVGSEIARQTWPHPLIDDLSFASLRTPWTPYSWLAEIGMARLWDHGGFRAAIAVQAFMEFGFIFLLGLGSVELSQRVHGQPRYLASAVGAAFGGILSLAYLSFRPVTASLVLLGLIAYLLLRDRRLNQKSKWVWLVPPLVALLVNIHFYAFFVPVWIAALLIGDFLESQHTAIRGLILLLCTLAACLCTPMLPGTVRAIVEYSSSDVMVHSSTIAEFQPFYHGTMGNIALGFCLITTLCALWRLARPPRLPRGEFFWLALGTILLFRMGRFAPLYAISAVPVFAATIPRLSDRILARPPTVATLAIVLVLITVPILRAFPGSNQTFSTWLNRNGTDAPNYPCLAADYVAQNVAPQTHHLLCDFTWGGYLEWRLGDQYQTLMDGRTQLFPPDFWKSAALAAAPQRQRFLSTIPADAAIVRVGPNKLRADLTALNWKPVYGDDFAEVWIPPRKPETRNQPSTSSGPERPQGVEGNDESISKSE